MGEKVYLSACAGYEWEPLRQAVAEQFQALELEKLVKPGCKAVIKPNLVVKAGPDSGIATHPLVTAAVAL